MKAGNIVAVGGVALIILWLRSRAKLFNSAMFTLKGVKVGGSLLNPELTIQLLAINNTPHSQDINRIEGIILLNDTVMIGNVLQLQKQVIAANSNSVIELPVSVRLSGVIDTIANLISRKTGKYTFDGVINVYGLNVPVKQSYTL